MNHWMKIWTRKKKSLTYELKIVSNQGLFQNLNFGTYIFPIVEPEFSSRIKTMFSFGCDYHTITESIIRPLIYHNNYNHSAILNVYKNGVHVESWGFNNINYGMFSVVPKKIVCSFHSLDIPNIKSNFIKSS